MQDWRGFLRSDPVPWLLNNSDPSLRYLLLTDVLGRPGSDPVVREAKTVLMSSGPVARILASQTENGHWGREGEFYQRSKYKGTVWNAILLAELGADSSDPRIARLSDFLLQWPKREDGGFTYAVGRDEKKKGGLPCLTANMVHALCRFGLGNDPRLDASVDALIDPLKGEVYKGPQGMCARCRSGKVKMLKALNSLPPQRASSEVKARRRELATDILETCLPRSADDPSPSRPEWGRLSFPLMWNTDLLEILDVLAGQGAWDERMRSAVDMVQAKQDDQGRWPLEGGWNGRMLVRFDRVGHSSPWVTLKVLTMLRHLPEPG